MSAMTLAELLMIGLTGLGAGLLGGLLGVGGSIVMIPVLTVGLGPDQHLYQAAAMAANVAVALPAALRHRRAGAIDWGVLRWMLPASVLCVLVGVALSNLPVFEGREGGVWLGRLLAVFQVYVVVVNVRKLVGRSGDEPAVGPASAGVSARASGGVGAAMGLSAGLLGIGGGAIAVPMQQALLRLPLRVCIANSSAVMVVSAAIGAVMKNATLAQHGTADQPLAWWSGLALAGLLAPLAIVGSRIGAGLTHRLPLRVVRVVFVGLMLVTAWKMAALPWG